MQPHGLNLNCSYEILGKEQTITRQDVLSKLEGFIEFENIKTGEKKELPMRSFVNNFIDKLHGILTGDGGTDTLKTSVSHASIGASTATYAGLLVGIGEDLVALSDTALADKIIHASFAYKGTTLIAPYFTQADKTRPLTFEIKRLFTNTRGTGYTITEIGLTGKPVTASGAKTVGLNMFSRDMIPGIVVPYNSDVNITFKFIVHQASNGSGGGVLNLLRMIFNLFYAGNQNRAGSRMIATNGTQPTIVYATGAAAAGSAGATNAFIVDGAASHYIGICVGYWGNIPDPDENPDGNPIVNADETTFTVDHTDLTVDANTISAVSNPYSNTSQFTISRSFTNTSATNAKYLDRWGLLTKGTNTGTTIPSSADNILLMCNRPSATGLYLQPGQTLRITYTFQIRA